MEFNKLVEDYGCLAFTDDVMKERIPKSTYKASMTACKGRRIIKRMCNCYCECNENLGS